jgi:hypothetical protein
VVYVGARDLTRPVAIGTGCAVVVIVAATVGFVALRQVAARLGTPALQTRNLDLGRPPLPRPLRALTDPPGPGVLAILVVAIGLAVDCRTPNTTAAATCLAIATALSLGPVVALAAHIALLVRSGARARIVEAARAAVERLAPEVIVYFASTAGEVYQVDQWLGPVEELGRPAAVMVRSEAVMAALGPTALPIICSPYNGTIAALPLPDRVVTLFPTHSGNNLSMIRRPETRTVFVGHGDSDKPDSVNPFARVYDEIWVAGPLGRRRYDEADIGVDDAAIVEVGRPQLDIAAATLLPSPVVVYAPTWEGWGDDPHHSSLAHIGVPLAKALAARPGITVRYRPHPLTGHRSPALRRAHAEVVGLLGEVPAAESLATTLAGASAVIADVSSVASEYLAYDRPYAVADTRGLGTAEFNSRFPVTAGGFVLGADLAGLDEFIAAAVGATDPTVTARRRLRQDALGDPATSQRRFAVAVDRLLTR